VSQHTPVVHCGVTHAPPEQPYVQLLHCAELGVELQYCAVVQSVITVHAPGLVLPVQVVAVPGQYWVTTRDRASDPHAVPLHPYSVLVPQA